MGKITLIATAAMGLESVVADEIRKLGYDCQVENGKVTFSADERAICRANLWLRTADRVKLKIGEFQATTFEELFEQTRALPWADFIPVHAQFPVIGKSVKSKLFSVSDCQAIVKKAVVESLKQRYRVSWFEETGPLFRIEVALHKDIATLTIDTSGAGLHKRGYRIKQGEAPLKETLAAALVQLTNWTPNRPFVDPFCGSGTIPIEAALIGQNIAPGFNRDFVSEQWDWIGKRLWEEAREEAEDLARYDEPLDISGFDIDHRMVEMAKMNAREAGLSDLITFKQMQVKDFRTQKQYGVIVGNPPYSERLGERKEVEQMYQDMGKTFASLDTWSIYILTSHRQFESLYGKKATKRRKLFNGFIETQYYQFWGPRPPRYE
ncbi:THUMP domain-containing class I SAM-dependent RNA methyltransferase [Thermolongibacillus altinsuensis]|uniref:THUMP domain-containing class I SAM-dependent RNA methyltransferase n=1 Tax=Thermolongibacillus altinsuensis TaxID=575256 RepID=UPI00242A3107|nr:class I SAM-dependent RNA methyltransferase [Thermolongibacillus altinsuensis]GMB08294.1 methyltransferase [Thermolongibacillus altinsuensis]